MKKTISTILLILSLLIGVLLIACCLYGFYDINRTLNELANDPSGSGIDYFGIGWGYGIILFALSVPELILSAVNMKLLQQKALRYISAAGIVISGLLMIASIYLFYR